MIKADVLGIPSKRRSWYQKIEYSRGVCCFSGESDINEIKVMKVMKDKSTDEKNTSCIDEQDNNSGKSLVGLEGNQTKPLPQWLDFEIKSGVLIMNATPNSDYDTGPFHVSIRDKQGYILRAHYIDIYDKNEPVNSDGHSKDDPHYKVKQEIKTIKKKDV